MNFRVKTHNAIAESGLTKLSEGNFSVSEEEKDPDAIILRSYKLPLNELNYSQSHCQSRSRLQQCSCERMLRKGNSCF